MKKWLLFLTSSLLAPTTTTSCFIKENIVTKQNKIAINIQPIEKYNKNLASEGEEIKWLISTKWMDLTAYTGIKSLAVFKYLYKAVELPNLSVGIGMFTHAKGKHSLQYMWPIIDKKIDYQIILILLKKEKQLVQLHYMLELGEKLKQWQTKN